MKAGMAIRDEQEQAFWEAIREAPEDDGPRLVYSDWLEDNGQPERAELVRVQCRLARLPEHDERAPALRKRSDQLLRAHKREWAAPVERLLHLCWHSVEFRRGLLEHLHVSEGAFLRDAEEFFRLVPLRSLFLIDSRVEQMISFRRRTSELAGCAALARLDALALFDLGADPAGVCALLGSDYLSGLRHLEVLDDDLGDETALALASARQMHRLCGLRLVLPRLGTAGARALAEAPHLAGLGRLALGHTSLDAGCLAVLASASFLPGLHELELTDCTVTDSGARTLAGAAGLAGLRKLGLRREGPPFGLRNGIPAGGISRPLGPEGARALAEGRPEALTELDLYNHAIGPEGAAALAGSPALRRLETLKLTGNGIGPDGARALAASVYLSGLRALELSQNRIGSEGLSALAASDYLSGLRVLRLDDNGIDDSGLKALAESGHLHGLVSLDLGQNSIGDEGARALARSGRMSKLAVLKLNRNKLSAASVEALAGSSALPNLCVLELGGNQLDGEAWRRLKSHFGDRL